MSNSSTTFVKMIIGEKAIVAKAKSLALTMTKCLDTTHIVLVSACNHALVHGDLRALDQVFAVVPAGLHRRGISLWVSEFSNLRYSEKDMGFRKPKGQPLAINIDKLQAIRYWDFAKAVAANNAEIDVMASVAVFIKTLNKRLIDPAAVIKDRKFAELALKELTSVALNKLDIPKARLVYTPKTKPSVVPVIATQPVVAEAAPSVH